jgi:NAD(P)-dependent dehydrogenase (short-subunit alcohol dehydrogenase family)
VALLYRTGAHVFFGDWDDQKGRELEKNVRATGLDGGGSVTFRKVDVRDYQSQLALFDDAYKRHGHVDAAMACAGVTEPGGWFEPEDLDLETVQKVCLQGLARELSARKRKSEEMAPNRSLSQ